MNQRYPKPPGFERLRHQINWLVRRIGGLLLIQIGIFWELRHGAGLSNPGFLAGRARDWRDLLAGTELSNAPLTLVAQTGRRIGRLLERLPLWRDEFIDNFDFKQRSLV